MDVNRSGDHEARASPKTRDRSPQHAQQGIPATNKQDFWGYPAS